MEEILCDGIMYHNTSFLLTLKVDYFYISKNFKKQTYKNTMCGAFSLHGLR